jgi:hypothetical protein
LLRSQRFYVVYEGFSQACFPVRPKNSPGITLQIVSNKAKYVLVFCISASKGR